MKVNKIYLSFQIDKEKIHFAADEAEFHAVDGGYTIELSNIYNTKKRKTFWDLKT